MRFSLEIGPPTKTELLNEEAELGNRIKITKYQERTLFFLSIVIFVLGLAVIICGTFSRLVNIEVGLTLFILCNVPGISSYILGKRIDALNKSLSELSDIPKTYCEEALFICSISTECEKYRQNVLRHGRKIAYGEFLMMRNSVPDGSQAYIAAKERRLDWAHNKLHS